MADEERQNQQIFQSGNRAIEDLQLAGLFGLAVAQPLFEVLQKNAQFFIVRRSPAGDFYSALIVVCLAIPLVFIAFRHLLDLISKRAGRLFHFLLMTTLFALLWLLLIKQLTFPPFLSILFSLILAAVSSYLYYRYMREWIYVLLFVAMIVYVPIDFLNSDDISRILSSESPLIESHKINARTPIVVLVLDELPLGSLLNREKQIDSRAFPNFARLQQQSTWFRNTSSVSDLTEKGVAAVITGLYPDQPRLPTVFDYPRNLFTLLGTSYELEVQESDTQFHPEKTVYTPLPETYAQRMESMLLDLSAIYLQITLPAPYAKAFPSLGHTWRDFWQTNATAPRKEKIKRAAPFVQWIDSIEGPPRPVLYFLHVELPHGPWMLFPSGTEYNFSRWSSPIAKEETLQGWQGDQIVAHRAFQRYMIQLVYVDLLIGKLLDRLNDLGLFDSSLLIVTADHGICFDPAQAHRPITNSNFVDTLSVPLFIKFPFQNEPSVDDRNAETIDVLPTIAQVVGANPGWNWDGESLLKPSTRKTRKAFSWMMRAGKAFQFDSFSYTDSRNYRLKLDLFGSELDPKDLFRMGPQPEVLGKVVQSLAPHPEERITAAFYNRKSLQNVDLAAGFVPALISGKIRFPDSFSDRSNALVALNGVVRASTPLFPLEDHTWGFATLVPENSFVQGTNDVTVLLPHKNGYLEPRKEWIP